MKSRTDKTSAVDQTTVALFAPGQRWISENEPELGLGTVTSADTRYVDMAFTSRNEARRYAVSSAPLRRIIFRSGDIVTDRKDGKYSVISVENRDGLMVYRCGNVSLPESELADTVNIANPVERLAHGIVDTIRDWDRRADLLRYRAEMLASPVRGFAGGRIDLLPHQLYIADKVSSQRVVRALLADEAGLGKTIEACLIIHRLLLAGRANRVLVMVPGHLVHQWFVELLRRFNLTFRIVTPEYCETFDKEDNPFLGDQLCLCSTERIEGDTQLAMHACGGGWDIVVVDEAHHLKRCSPAFELVKNLSGTAGGLLLLTATPEQLGQEDHFARLQLLDPHRYTDFELYRQELDMLQELHASITGFLKDHHVDLETDLPETILLPVPERFLQRLGGTAGAGGHKPGGRAVSMPLDQLIDLFGTGSIMFRNTRRNIAGFPERAVHVAELAGDAGTIKRMRDEFASDNIGPDRQQLLDILPEDPRVLWLAQLIKKMKTEKFLVICSTKKKAESLLQALQSKCKVDVALFHEEMTILQSDRNAAWFSEEKGARVLISSEMGSEGRNFQFCHSLVMFDLPMNPELVEQRIGRLDRIGQRSLVNIYVPYVAGTPQEVVCRWYHEGINALSRNEPSAERVFESQRGELASLCGDLSVNADRLKKILLESANLVGHYSSRLLNARDRLFEMGSYHLGESREIITGIRTEDAGRRAAVVMERLFEHYGIAVEDAGPKKQALITEYVTDHAFPLPRGERPVITSDRQTALDREDLEFITIDHPMVRDALDLYLSSDHATTAFALVPDPLLRELALESIFIVECIGPAYCQRFLPPTPLRIVVNHKLADVTASYPASIIRSHGANGSIMRFVANRKASETAVPEMIAASNAIASSRSQPVINGAIETMRSVLDREISRLTMLQATGAGGVSESIERCILEKGELEKAYQSARIRLEALRVIWRGPVKERPADKAGEEVDDE